MKKQTQMEVKQEQLLSTSTEDEQLTGYNCPVCGYPIVIEMGLEVCYNCGWSGEDKTEGYYEE